MNNENISKTRKTSLYVLVVVLIAVILIGVYFYSRITPTTGPTSGRTPTGTTGISSPSEGCVCDWNKNYECGGILECRAPSESFSWEKICECKPSGCGSEKGITCDDSSEGVMACTPDEC